VLATRLYTLEGFAMTAGILVPLDSELIEYAIADTPQLLRKGQEEAINDRRFAESIYRAAVASGIMERVAYQDTIAEAGWRWSERLLSRNVVCAWRALAWGCRPAFRRSAALADVVEVRLALTKTENLL
jgi:hypothetical protein